MSSRNVEKIRGWNNIEYGVGSMGKNTPSTGLSMNRAYIPPGGIAKAHIHVDFDVMIYLLKGECEVMSTVQAAEIPLSTVGGGHVLH